jgi:glutamine cyclotransferase
MLSALFFGSFVCFLADFFDLIAPYFGINYPQYPVYLKTKIIHTFDTDPSCFTQSLVLVNSSYVLMSCGGYGKSRLQLNSLSGSREKPTVLYRPPGYIFLEGAAVINSTVYTLTWREKQAFRLSLANAGMAVETLTLGIEGWGLAAMEGEGNQTALVASNGTEWLSFMDLNFSILGTCKVVICFEKQSCMGVQYINHLTYSKKDKLVYANIYANYGDNFVLGILVTGDKCTVTKVIDVGDVGVAVRDKRSQVMNGLVALESGSGEYLVTGKMWGKIFQVQTEQNEAARKSEENLQKIILGPNPLV